MGGNARKRARALADGVRTTASWVASQGTSAKEAAVVSRTGRAASGT